MRGWVIALFDIALMIAMSLLLFSCKASSFYPLIGSAGGATAGSLGGPVAAGGGAILGYGIGKGAQLVDENENLADQVSALSEGDIKKLLELEAEKHGSKIEELWNVGKYILVLIALWNLIPILLARKACQVSKQNKENLNGKNNKIL